MTSEQLPFHIGRYQVTHRLGAGGMGVVYLATDDRLHRQVAIKRLLKNPASDSAHLRIRKEALLLAQLNHANIVQIYDVVEERNDVALVMEYVDGCSLDNWQRERSPSLHQKVLLLKQICNGLARAHSIGIIHRDLKADNILVDDNNTAKITDFGIAKNWREHSDLTREQHIAGSWSAMSPEQALGRALDNRCDLFALGMLSYRLLCGQGPFGDHESPFVLVDRVVNNAHPPAGKLNPDLPPALCQLLDRLLAKEPHKRPLNATAVAAELDSILLGLNDSDSDSFSRTVTITAEDYYQRRRRHRGWRKTLAGAAATGAVALVATAALSLWPEAQPKPRDQYIAVVAPHENAFESREHKLLASSMLSAIEQGLSSRAGLLLVPYSESLEVRGQPLRHQARALDAQLLLHPSLNCESIHCEVSLELIDAGNFAVTASRSAMLELNESRDSRARILRQLNHLFPDNPPDRARANYNVSAEDYQRYLALFEQQDNGKLPEILQTLEALQDKNPSFPPYYRLYGELAYDDLLMVGNSDTFRRLEKFLQRVPYGIEDHPAVLTARLNLATVRDDRVRAEKLLAKLKVTMADRAGYYYLRATYHEVNGEYQKALAAIDRALARRTTTTYLYRKAMILSLSGNMDEARPYLLQAIELNKSHAGALTLLAGNEVDSGRPAEAIHLLEGADAEQIGPLDTYTLCLAYYIDKQLEQAQRCLTGLADDAAVDADVVLYQAEIARLQQQPEKVAELARHALALTDGRKDRDGLLMRALAYAELGRAGRATETLLQISRSAPENLYTNYARAQIYITTGDMLSAKAHIRNTLERGMSPIWLQTPRFAPICTGDGFADLRREYPSICAEGAENTRIAQK